MSNQLSSGPQMTVHQPDYMGQPGAAMLVARIVAYWQRKGKAASVWTEERVSGLGHRDYVVRSSMKGGQP